MTSSSLRSSIRLQIGGILLTAGLLMASTGCTDKKAQQANEPAPLQSAVQLIDEGRYTEAISILESHQAPTNDPKVTLTLASAYAARAGIRVEDFWGFVVGYDRLLFNKDQTDDSDIPISINVDALPPGVSKSTLKFLKNLNVNLTQLNQIVRRLKQVPYVAAEPRKDLDRAIVILSAVAEPGAHLYRSILSIIVMRSDFEDLSPSLDAWSESHFNLCDPNLGSISSLLFDLRDHLEWLTDDLAIAYPSEAAKFADFKGQIQSSDPFFDTLKNAQASSTCP